MFNLAKLFVSFEAQTKPFDDALAKAEADARSAADAIGKSTSVHLGSPSAGDGGGAMKGAAADAGRLAGQIRSALSGAFAPLNTFAARFGDQFNRVGGTITTLARRIDSAMKTPAIEAFAKKLDKGISDASKKAADGLNFVEKATLKLGPAASKAIGVYSGFGKIKSIFTNFGDVAGKPLDKIAKTDFGRPTSSAKQLAGAIKSAKPAVESVTGSVRKLGAEIAIALGIFGAVFQGVQFIKGGISGAANLAETVGKTKEVFGDFTGSVTGQAEGMAKAFGLPKQAMLDAASSFGLIARGAGQSKEQAAGMSNSLAKLAADASSFYNVPLDQALDKIRSGLVGEAEPLRAFGVLLSEEAVKAEAAAMGLAKKGQELDEQAKVMARASLIEKGLATASGDLERTQGSAANQFRKLSGTIENTATSVGAVLLPAVTKGAQLVNEGVGWIAGAFEANKAMFEGWVASVSEAFDAVAAVVRNWPAALEIARLKAVESLLNFMAVLETVPENAARLAGYFAENWTRLIVDAFNATGQAELNFATNLQNLGAAIGAFFADPTQGFKFEWTPLLDGFEATAGKLPELVKPHLVSMQKEIDEQAKKIADDVEKRAADAKSNVAGKRGDPEGPAKKKPKEKKEKESEEFGFADFARKLASKQLDERDKKIEENTKSVDLNTKALNDAANAIKGGVFGVFA